MRPKVKDRVEVRSLKPLPREAQRNDALLNPVLRRWEPGDLPHLVDALAKFVCLRSILCPERYVSASFPIPRPFPVFKHGVTMREHQISRVNDYPVLPRRLAEVIIRKHAFVLGVEDVALLLIPRTGEDRHDHHALLMLVWCAGGNLDNPGSAKSPEQVFEFRVPVLARKLIVSIHDED